MMNAWKVADGGLIKSIFDCQDNYTGDKVSGTQEL